MIEGKATPALAIINERKTVPGTNHVAFLVDSRGPSWPKVNIVVPHTGRGSQEELGHRAGKHWTYIGGIERGERNPTLAVIAEQAEAPWVSFGTARRSTRTIAIVKYGCFDSATEVGGAIDRMSSRT